MQMYEFILTRNEGYITYRGIQDELDLAGTSRSLGSVWNDLQSMGINEKKFHMKASLTPKNKIQRLQWVLQMIDISNPNNLVYKHQHDVVCIDEVWIYLQRRSVKLKYLPDHQPYANHRGNKGHIPKVMVSCAMSEQGKHGLIIHGDIRPCPRASRNRPRGTPTFYPKTVDSEEFYDGQTKNHGIIDQINREDRDRYITIQNDNATPHTGHGTQQKLNDYCEDNDLEMEYILQPPNSYDLNILDLSFNASFKSTMSRQGNRFGQGNLTRLVAAIQTLWDEYPMESITRAYGHQNACYNEILRLHGDNNYSPPHAHVGQRIDQGLPVDICSINLVQYNELKEEVVEFNRLQREVDAAIIIQNAQRRHHLNHRLGINEIDIQDLPRPQRQRIAAVDGDIYEMD